MTRSESAVQVCLASQSPRRRDLLMTLGVTFSVRAANIDESNKPGEAPAEYVQRLAREKATAIWSTLSVTTPVLAADTCVSVDNAIFGKPTDLADSTRMLTALSGRQHDVFTGVFMCNADGVEGVLSHTKVWFKPLTATDIERYWQSGEPQDKAGSYAIQGIGGSFVTHMEGSYSGVVGLPLYETGQLLSRYGVSVL